MRFEPFASLKVHTRYNIPSLVSQGRSFVGLDQLRDDVTALENSSGLQIKVCVPVAVPIAYLIIVDI